ncbi:ABC transporter permease [Nocardioides ochotonae]|uniref:ABC transporter permease n=1 Tax=Nocardioides ochotonae TaxID=2685869 RepID=UPI001CD26BA0|nr:ABC transporter permease [Nocardioides ochotonae]
MRTALIRIGELVAVLMIVSFGVFMLVSLLPGDPAVSILGDGRSPEEYAAKRAELGLDDNVIVRYLDWLGSALRGDLGTSLIPPQNDVVDRILAALPVSVQLAAMGLLMALAMAIPLAMWSASRPGGLADRIIGASMFAVLSVPSFLAGLLLIAVFANGLGWFPRAQWVRITEDPIGSLYHSFLPALTIALMELATFTRVLRNDLIGTLNEDYILSAKAKGMPPWRILVIDALRPSSFSLITLLGISMGRLVGSTVIVEYLFALPGMGGVVVNAANQGDYPLVQGSVLVIAAIYVLVNAGIDLSYGYLDPRTRRVHA